MKTVVLDGSTNLTKKIDGDLSLNTNMDGQAGTYIAVGTTHIEPLTVTENGTYMAPIGAYNPVIVDVPIPPNYGLITWNGSVLRVS